MKHIYIATLAALALCGTAKAQDIYKIEALSGNDLTGTARFVGMGGAMSALGADMSAMSSNPAAIGLYRRSDVALTGAMTFQPNGESFADIDRARASFDQAGFVWSTRNPGGDKLRFFNLGFNYQKRRNFKNYIGLDNVALEGGLSSSWEMAKLAYYNNQPLDLRKNMGGESYTTPYAVTAYDAQMIGAFDADGNLINNSNVVDQSQKIAEYGVCNADRYNYQRAQWGGIQEYDFNASFNINDRFYTGLTFGLYNVDMHSRLSYSERLINENGETGTYNMEQMENLTGMGLDLKFGFIVRPIEDSPFRIGLSVSTPTFYALTQNSYLKMTSPNSYTEYDNYGNGTEYNSTEADYGVGDYDYRIRTPWKLGISMASTIGSTFAWDVEYEVSRYTGAQVRYPSANDGGYYDDWGDWHYSRSSERDKAMDIEIDNYLKPVSTLRLGFEVKPAEGISLRAGYNFVSSPFDKDAYLNVFTDSPSYNYSTNVDYVNLGCINRLTLGIGYRGKHFYGDFAYQGQFQKADVYAFYASDDYDHNLLTAESFKLDRHNFMLTVGYHF